MGNFTLGSYVPMDSVIHKMDPRSKIIIMLLLMISIFIPSGIMGYILIGLSIAPVYAFCWTLWEKEPWARFNQKWLDNPTKWAEIIVGGIVFYGCYLLRWGL